MALQLAKFSGALPVIQADLGLSLTQASIIFSVVPLALALTGIFGAQLLAQAGVRRAALGGLGLLAVASLGGSQATTFASLFAWRLLECLGYMAGIIALPILVSQSAVGGDRGKSMGLWSGAVPTGFTLTLVASGPILDLAGWQGMWILAAACPGILAVVIAWLFPPDPPAQGTAGKSRFAEVGSCLRNPEAWALSLNFLLFAFQFIGVTSLLPTFLVASTSLSLTWINIFVGLAISLNIIGNVMGGYLLGNVLSMRFCCLSTTLSLLVCSLVIFLPDLPDLVRFAGIALFCLTASLLPGAVWAAVPGVFNERKHTATLAGMIMQCMAVGQLLGPILIGLAVESSKSWAAALLPLGAATVASIVLILRYTPEPAMHD